MDNRLIFRYHLTRDQAGSGVLREPLLREGLPTDPVTASEGGTQKGSSTQAVVVLGQACRGRP